jgi:crotonobetainyl-CoA:carnitine CoA-transferase CaiB-like acyl-CoA transferase
VLDFRQTLGMAGALEGIRVADFSRVLAGPIATMILGDLGADVIKVERPRTGDDTRAWGPPWSADGDASYYLALNRNKRSIVLDLKDPDDLAAAGTLALESDVVVDNFRPGVMASCGLDHASLSVDRPGIVSCRIAGLGLGDLAGYDFLAQAVGGLMSITGEPDGEPHKVGVAVVDVMAGLHAVIGILAALRHRDRTGEGQLVEIDLLSTTLFGLANQASNWLTADAVPGRMGNRHPSIAPYELLDAADGPFVVAVGNDAQFRTFCEALGVATLAADERFATNAARVTNRDAMLVALAPALATRSAAAWVERLAAAGIACGMVNQVDEAFAYARTLGLEPTVAVDGVDTVANPLRLSVTPATYRLAPPALGEHGDEIRADLSKEMTRDG